MKISWNLYKVSLQAEIFPLPLHLPGLGEQKAPLSFLPHYSLHFSMLSQMESLKSIDNNMNFDLPTSSQILNDVHH